MPGPMKLNPETRLALDAIRHSDEPSPVYGLESDRAIELLREVTEPMFEGAALPAAVLMQVRWFVLELARLFRTRYGYALAFQLELLLRKWHDFGVEPNTLQFIVTEVARHTGESRTAREGAAGQGAGGGEGRTEQKSDTRDQRAETERGRDKGIE